MEQILPEDDYRRMIGRTYEMQAILMQEAMKEDPEISEMRWVDENAELLRNIVEADKDLQFLILRDTARAFEEIKKRLQAEKESRRRAA